jgi:hypothetical protein
MGSNKRAREELERIYGKGSMFERSHTADYVSTLPVIKGYKKFIEEKHFTTKDIKKLTARMSYHHLHHKADGGNATTENGAVVNELEHRYLHSLPRHQEEIINNHIRQWKLDYISLCAGDVIDSGEVDLDLSEDVMEIPVQEFYTYRKTKAFTIKELQQKERRREKRELQRIKKELEDR